MYSDDCSRWLKITYFTYKIAQAAKQKAFLPFLLRNTTLLIWPQRPIARKLYVLIYYWIIVIFCRFFLGANFKTEFLKRYSYPTIRSRYGFWEKIYAFLRRHLQRLMFPDLWGKINYHIGNCSDKLFDFWKFLEKNLRFRLLCMDSCPGETVGCGSL